MNWTKTLFVLALSLLPSLIIVEVNAQQKIATPPVKQPTNVQPDVVQTANTQPTATQPAEENISDAVRKELEDFYNKIKSIDEDCKLKSESLKIALSAEAQAALGGRKEERKKEKDH